MEQILFSGTVCLFDAAPRLKFESAENLISETGLHYPDGAQNMPPLRARFTVG